MKTLEFEIKLAEKDVIEFNFIHIYRVKPQGKILIILGILMVILGFLGLSISGSFDSSLLYLICLIIGFYILIIFPVTLIIRSKSNYAKDNFIKKTLRYNFSEMGFSVNSENGNMKIQWHEMDRIIEFSNVLLIYISRNKAYAIPKRMIEKEYGDLIGILNIYMSKEKLRLKGQK